MTKAINKRNIVISISILSALVIGILLGLYYIAPSNYLALDVNPSIEIHTNRLNEVTSINPVNEDAEQIMEGYELTDRNLETVIKNIVDRMVLNGFIAPDKDNQILLTTDENQNSTQISNTVNGIITDYLTEKQVTATIIPQSIKVTSQSIEEAHKSDISVGKMAMIQKLIENDSTLTVEGLSTERISDLVAIAESKNVSLASVDYENSTEENTDDTNVSSETQADNQNNNNEVQDENKSIENNVDDQDEKDDQDDQDDQDEQDDEDNNVNENAEDKEDSNNGIKKHYNSDKSYSKHEEQNHSKKNADIEDQDENDKEDQEDKDIEDHDDNDIEDKDDNDIEDQDDNNIEDQEDNDIEDQEDNDIEDDSDIEDKQDNQKDSDKEDRYENQNDSDNED